MADNSIFFTYFDYFFTFIQAIYSTIISAPFTLILHFALLILIVCFSINMVVKLFRG